MHAEYELTKGKMKKRKKQSLRGSSFGRKDPTQYDQSSSFVEINYQ